MIKLDRDYYGLVIGGFCVDLPNGSVKFGESSLDIRGRYGRYDVTLRTVPSPYKYEGRIKLSSRFGWSAKILFWGVMIVVWRVPNKCSNGD